MAIAAGTACLIAIMTIAIMDQPFSWWVVPFVILFGTIFLGMLWMSLSFLREDRFREVARAEHPEAPWLWDTRWQSDLIQSRSKADFWGTLAFFVILAVFALMGAAQIIDKLPKGNFATLLGVIPIWAAAYFGHRTLRAWELLRLDKGFALELQTRPAWTGDALSAVLMCPNGFLLNDADVRLELFKTIRRQEFDEITFTKVVDRKIQGRATITQGFKGKPIIDLHVDIPHTSPETDWTADRCRWWELVVTLGRTGDDLALRYEVPVAAPR